MKAATSGNSSNATLVLDAKATLGEGPSWHHGINKLFWVDIEGKAVHLFDPKTKEDKLFPVGQRVGCIAPLADGNILAALQNGIHFMNIQTGELSFLDNPIDDPDIRFNDGKCDPAGRFWMGTMHLEQKKGVAALYRMDADNNIRQILDGVTVSNGLVWTADKKTMYYIDTPTHAVRAFDYDEGNGNISRGRIAFEIPESEGSPDGMTIDVEGNLWIALWGGGGVACFDPATGKMLRKIQVPAPHTTACTFGGDDFKTLYITSARDGLSEEQLNQYPQSGGLFAIQPGVAGLPASFFAGTGRLE